MRSGARGAGVWPALCREAAFLLRDRALWVAWCVVLGLSAVAVSAGLSEVRQQHATIARLVDADRADRLAVLNTQKDWGSAAYHAFHFSFDPPSDFAFAALGRRDDTAWKHRVRMLALEGQIHERDAGHPVLALAGRHDLLVATAGTGARLWPLRAGLRAAGVFVAAALPLLVAGLVSGTAASVLLAACALLLAHLLFWTLVCAGLAAWRQTGELILATLLGLWILLAVLLPAAGRIAIDRAVPMPSGAEIIMTQREAVHAAWDLPKAVTMAAFLEQHGRTSPRSSARSSGSGTTPSSRWATSGRRPCRPPTPRAASSATAWPADWPGSRPPC
jgi:ABC-2 type transport system permease protein